MSRYEQADALLSKATFPETEVSNNQHARYLYYSGRVRAVQLNYTESYRLLLAAQRKAPQQRARGFRIAVLKLSTVVQLLMGDIPDKSTLTSPDIAVALSACVRQSQSTRAFHFHHVLVLNRFSVQVQGLGVCSAER